MIRRLIIAFGVVAAAVAMGPLCAEPADPAKSTTSPAPEGSLPAKVSEPPATAPVVEHPVTPEAVALRNALSGLAVGDSDEERNEHAAVLAFYEARSDAPLWLTPAGALTSQASAVIAEIKRAQDWGLDPRDFRLPEGLEQSGATSAIPQPTPEKITAAEINLSQAVLKYGRYARGGRIINPAEQLSSYLDRRPQFLQPRSILDGIAAAEQADAYLRGLHPTHPQFEKLRQKYLAALGRNKQAAGGKKARGVGGSSAEAKRLLANMEEWRWMPADMGDLYVWNNIPEFIQRVVKNGEVVRKERIVVGELSKQTPIFTRPMRKITFKPTWKVPDSIKVRELWPSLLRGGGLMREWALEVTTKDGQPIDWRKIDWRTADIRTYEVIQEYGSKSVMGKVKFAFPSQHTVFMHDSMERDKYMFNVSRRTFSHGCMRVANPIGLAAVLLREDKGWDAGHVAELVRKGPNNNEISLDRRIPVHITYFTAMVGDDGKLNTFPDVYGHERRITMALEGKWDKIAKGRDHLAPVELSDAPIRSAGEGSGRRSKRKDPDPFESLFGL